MAAYERRCEVCGDPFVSARCDANACSVRCRKKASRDRQKVEGGSNPYREWWLDRFSLDEIHEMAAGIDWIRE
jgi:hypothetical protein